jgi:hypothetical protein
VRVIRSTATTIGAFSQQCKLFCEIVCVIAQCAENHSLAHDLFSRIHVSITHYNPISSLTHPVSLPTRDPAATSPPDSANPTHALPSPIIQPPVKPQVKA